MISSYLKENGAKGKVGAGVKYVMGDMMKYVLSLTKSHSLK